MASKTVIKTLKTSDVSEHTALLREICHLAKLKHDNIINLVGWADHKRGLCMLIEFAENGSLHDIVHSKSARCTLEGGRDFGSQSHISVQGVFRSQCFACQNTTKYCIEK